MTVRAFILLLITTVIAIWIGDRYAVEFTSPGMERSFAVLVIAGAIVAPVAWLLSKLGWIKGRFELGRKKQDGARNGSDA